MSKQTSICLIVSLLSTLGIFLVGLFVAAAASMSFTYTNGISMGAGGVSNKVVLLLIVVMPILFVGLFILARKLLGLKQ